MSRRRSRLVVLGLSLSSSWGNGHATTYRALLRALAEIGYDTLFLERERTWYADNRDLADPDFCRLAFYDSPAALERHRSEIAFADAVMIGSYVPDGADAGRRVCAWANGVTAFYDIDTPVTLADVDAGTCAYLDREMIRAFDLYLSFTGGPTLDRLERDYRAKAARELFCSVDTRIYVPMDVPRRWDLGYLGTYSPDRQPALERLLIEPARRAPHLRFVVAGSQFPAETDWPANVDRIEHLPPSRHPEFYSSLGWTLNLTRRAMIEAGFSPSVRLFESAACAVPVVSDRWDGMECAFSPGREILIADTPDDVLSALTMNGADRQRLAHGALGRVLVDHTARHRARELARHLESAEARKSAASRAWTGRSLEDQELSRMFRVVD